MARDGIRRYGRAAALSVVCAALVVGAVVGTHAVLTGDAAKADASDPTQPTAPRPTRPTDPPTTTTTTDPPTTTTTNPSLPPLPLPTATAPLRVLAIGDSLGIDLGRQIRHDLDATRLATVTMLAKGNTGLARPDYYDWPRHLRDGLATYHPEVVVMFFGANDGQGLYANGRAAHFGTPEWSAEYTLRIDTMLATALAASARVVWVGVPPMRDAGLDAHMAVIAALGRREAGRFPGVRFVSGTTVLGAPDGSYTKTIVDDGGGTVTVRTPDGVHINAAGAEVLTQAVVGAFARFFVPVGARAEGPPVITVPGT